MAELPARIGVYEIQARLGVGGMAETYLALRRGPGGFAQRVCLKRIRQDVADDPELVRQFLAEAAVVARLRHATITQVLDFGREGDDYYMALELIDGVDLRELLDRHPAGLPPELVHYVACELATALDFAHRAGGEPDGSPIVHRDVSTSNVLLSREGEVKLSDFGIARALDAPKHTRTGIVRGKVPYLSPEYARSGRFDVRSDLFSLGVVLYECLSGTRPHDGPTELETLARASRGQRVPLGEAAAAVPAGLALETEALLEAEPELRTQSAAALLEALLQLPGSPRARRELAALVRACQAARSPSKRPPASEPAVPVGPTEPWDARAGGSGSAALAASSAIAGTAIELGAARVRVGRGALFALIAALALGAGVLGYAANRGLSPATTAAPELDDGSAGTRPAATTAVAPTAVPADRPLPPTAAMPTAGELTASTNASAEQPRAARRNATLDVVVVPYGEVLVDGRSVGDAPLSVSLPPGDHTVVGRNRDGTFQRAITLHPGERKQLVLR